MIIERPEEWCRLIVSTGSPQEMRLLEAEILKTADAMNDTRSFNMHNGDGKFTTAGMPGTMTGKKHTPEAREKLRYTKTTEHRQKISKTLAGRKNPEHSIKMMGKKQTPESNEKRRLTMLAKGPCGEEVGRKISESKKGKPNGLLGMKRKPYKTSKSHEIITCPHCNTTGGASAMKRWHFDYCKLKKQ